jgi:hypothetical protein
LLLDQSANIPRLQEEGEAGSETAGEESGFWGEDLVWEVRDILAKNRNQTDWALFLTRKRLGNYL